MLLLENFIFADLFKHRIDILYSINSICFMNKNLLRNRRKHSENVLEMLTLSYAILLSDMIQQTVKWIMSPLFVFDCKKCMLTTVGVLLLFSLIKSLSVY